MKIHLLGAKFFHAERQTRIKTDRREEANVAFRNFANAPTGL
jgi:hypothetical protein